MSIEETDPFLTTVEQSDWDRCLKFLSKGALLKELLVNLDLDPEQVTSEIDKARVVAFIRLYEIAATLVNVVKP